MDEVFIQPVLDSFVRLFHAFAAGALVGMQRERAEKPAGLRTHILVCLGSALITVVSFAGLDSRGFFFDNGQGSPAPLHHPSRLVKG